MTVADVRYRAFISYSHRDQGAGRWLHRALESYRVPARLVGRVTASGEIGKRLGAIFRDRDELPVAADLSGKINDALAATQFLIVLCSPASAQSKWVNQEIINFKRLKGEDSIICVIVEGEPFASRAAGREAEECFAPALRVRVAADGALTNEPAEPIAADLRPGKDGKRLVKLKVIAGLLGVGLDELVRRENARRQQRMFWVAVASAAASVVMAVLTVTAFTARNDAERQKIQAESLIEFMLGDLRQKLQPVGRLDVLDSVGDKALAYFGTLKPSELDANTLGRKARALHMLGEIEDLRGNLDDALKVFEEASKTTEELLVREPDNPQRMFEHGQSKYWVGYAHWQRGQLKPAETAFREYQQLSERLAALDHSNTTWQTEVAHSRNNMGVLLLKLGRPSDAIITFESAEAVYKAVAEKEPGNHARQLDLAQSYAWLADAHELAGSLERTQFFRTSEVAIYERVRQTDPKNRVVTQSQLIAVKGLAILSLDRGQVAEAIQYFQQALALAEILVQSDESNMQWADFHAYSYLSLAEALQFAMRYGEAGPLISRAKSIAANLSSKQPSMVQWTMLANNVELLRGIQASGTGDTAGAIQILDSAVRNLTEINRKHPDNTDIVVLRARTLLALGDAYAATGSDLSSAAWSQVVTDLSAIAGDANHRNRMFLAIAHHRLNQDEAAAKASSALCQAGFRRPAFAQVCERIAQRKGKPGAQGQNRTE